MKARKVKGLDPDGPLDGNLRRIVSTRLAELRSFGPAVLDPDAVDAQHDMRIAAKRARALQDVLGEMHDCDVGVPRILTEIDRLRAEDVAAVRDSAGPDAGDIPPDALRRARNRRRYAGLESLVTYLRARREVLYGEFLRTWTAFEQSGLGGRLDGAAG